MSLTRNRQARRTLGRAHRAMRAENWSEAGRLFDEAARLAPDDARPAIWSALAAGEAGDLGKAKRHNGTALERSDGACAMAVLAARVLLDAGRYDEARDMAERARKTDPANPLANAYAALAVLGQGRYADAAAVLHGKEIPDSTGLQARILVETERAHRRVQDDPPQLDGPIPLEPANRRFLPVLSWVQERYYGWKDRLRQKRARRLLARGRPVAAYVLANEEPALDSQFTPGEGPLMEFAKPAHDHLLAESDGKGFADADTMLLAQLAALVGQFDVANRQLDRLRKGRRAKAYEDDINLAAGLVQFWIGKADGAVRLLQAVVDRHREDTLALYFLGVAHLHANRRAQARRVFLRLCALEPWRGTRRLLDFYEWLNRGAGFGAEEAP